MSPTTFVSEYFENQHGKIYKNSNRPKGRVNSKSGSFISVQRWSSEWPQMNSKNSQIKLCYTSKCWEQLSWRNLPQIRPTKFSTKIATQAGTVTAKSVIHTEPHGFKPEPISTEFQPPKLISRRLIQLATVTNSHTQPPIAMINHQ